ncbi:MFS transporter [Bacillus shivajii]|uniref:MFS transporter n=1 Tax=Bacillus shivajii TaxID=1983719 RepID=UPI001CFA5198|nr:MFS transporter [Bacillus shivajii]UCZ54537.1 MFS transporter [Bacillus shivajii]
MNSKERMIIMVLSMLPLIMVVGNSIFIPILPNIEHALMLHPTETGWIITAFAVPAAVTIPLIGYLSDLYGRKKLILISLAIICIGNVISIIAAVIPPFPSSYLLLLVGRAIQGFGAGGTAPLAMTMVGDLFREKKRSVALGAIEVSNGVGKMMSPFLGILAVMIIWYSSFFLYFLMALVAFLTMFFFIKFDKRAPYTSFHDYRKTIQYAFKRQYYWLIPVFFTGGVVLFILFGLLFYLSYEAERIYGIIGWSKGVLFFIPFGLLTIASYVSGKFIGGNDEHIPRVMFVSLLLLFLSVIIGMIDHNFYVLMFVISAFSIGAGLLLPVCNLFVTSSVSKSERGMVVSIYSMVRFLGVALGPLIYSYWMMYEWDMFLRSTLLLMGMTALLYTGWVMKEKRMGALGSI